MSTFEERYKLPTDAKVMETILENIGKTPLVRINKISKEAGLKCNLLAKCEFFNAGGSVKDRIGFRMVDDAEKSGRIKPGDVLIEPTSGNTGIGLALAAAIRGYRMIITLPEKMSQEKVDVLKALGAEIIRTPTEAAWDSPESHIGVALRLNKEIPNSHILDQYTNPSNPLAHYDGTAEELLRQTGGKIDMVVVSAGTGGTISGIAKKLKEKLPNIKVVGVDPVGSILAQPETLNDHKRLQPYQVEGIGYDFIPDVLNRDLVDTWIKTNDQDSFMMSRRLIREEGLLCGGSCGSAMTAALRAAKDLKEGQNCVVMMPDSTRNYMTKFLNDDWMIDNGFMAAPATTPANKEWWSSKTVQDLGVSSPCTVRSTVTIRETVKILNDNSFDQLPVLGEKDEILGVVTAGHISSLLASQRCKPTDVVTKAIFKQFRKVNLATPLHQLANYFDKDHYALVVQSQKCFDGGDEPTMKHVIAGVVTRIDLLKFITDDSAQ